MHPPDIELTMHMFTFQSRARPDLVGFTTRRTGSNLPEEFGPWVLTGQGAMHTGDPVVGIYGGADTVLAGIDRDGFTLAELAFRLAAPCELAGCEPYGAAIRVSKSVLPDAALRTSCEKLRGN